jgi:DNA-formamidopyrimidine glycosylase/dephospho-CoA kinase
MEGKYFEFDENEKNTKHARVIFHLDNNKKMIYDDSRCFGIMKLTSEDKYLLEEEISKLGPEPFDVKDINEIYQKAQKTSLPIKTFLLDQSVMTGLGNIYVDETLFASKLYPLTPAKDISLEKWEDIINKAVIILNKAIASGGSTIKSYHPGKNIDGNFQVELKVYGKRNERCPICDSRLKFMKVNGRGTTYCPSCQNNKKDKLFIAITGKIAAGKSTVLKAFKDLGADVISSDEIVKELYLEKRVAKLISKAFSLTFENTVDKDVLRKYLSENPKDIKVLNSVIHPLVKERIFDCYNKSKSKIVIAEVPLLFEAKMENDFDYVIGVNISREKQLERLNLRNPNTAEKLLKINSNSMFDKNIKNIDFIIDNNDTTDILLVDIKYIFSKLLNYLN